MNELVEVLRRNNHRSRHKHAHIRPLVVQIVFLQHMIQERQASSLAAHSAVAATRKPDGVVVGIRRIFRHNAQCLIDAVVVDQTDIVLPHVLYICLVLNLQRTDRSAYGEQSPCKQPLTQIVVVTQSAECGW